MIDMRPDMLANQGDPAELLPELAALDRLSAEQREALDYALGYWVLEVLQRPADTESLALLDRLAACAQQRSDGDERFAAKLSALRDLLENKRLAVATRASQPSLHLAHAQAILSQLRTTAMMEPAEIARRIELDGLRVNGLLAVMEQDGLIERHRDGRRHWVRLSCAAQAPAVADESAEAEFEVWEGDELFAGASGPRAQAWAELQRYAAQCKGVIRVFEVSRVERTLSYVPVQGTEGA